MAYKIETEDAPAALGPYSQAVAIPASSALIFVSGQLPIETSTGKLIDHDIKQAAECVLNNIKAILVAAASDLSKVIRVEIFLKDMAHFAEINEVYKKFFNGEVLPARQTVQVARLPKDALLEISCIAYKS